MKEDVPCFLIVKQTAWEKIQPSWPMFQQDHHVNFSSQIAGTWFQRPGIISLWHQKRLPWLETSESYSNPLLIKENNWNLNTPGLPNRMPEKNLNTHSDKYSSIATRQAETCRRKGSGVHSWSSCERSPRKSTGFTSFEKVHTHTDESSTCLSGIVRSRASIWSRPLLA